jgi:hydroxyethylthiazole kinase-like uncharacterized protein yjeF
MKTVTVAEMRELERKAIDEIGIPSIILMENAGRAVSEIAVNMLGEASGKKIAVICGTGNNGGDGFVSARFLARKNAEVRVYIVGKKSFVKNDPAVNLNILEKAGIEVREISLFKDIEADLIIDAIFGIGLRGEVKEPSLSVIRDLNKRNMPVLSVDVPSGLDADSGDVLGEAVKAAKTVTMQFPKKGFYLNKGLENTGEILVVDVGIPQN